MGGQGSDSTPSSGLGYQIWNEPPSPTFRDNCALMLNYTNSWSEAKSYNPCLSPASPTIQLNKDLKHFFSDRMEDQEEPGMKRVV